MNMELNPRKWSKKQKIIAGAVVAVLLVGGGTTVAVINHNNQVKAEQVQKAYNDLKAQAKKAVQTAETFKAEGDLVKANEAVKKLKEVDQKGFLERTSNLADLWKAVTKANEAVMKAEKSKKEGDLAPAQKAVDGLKDKKQADLKASLQKRLDTVKKAIQKAKDDKAKAEKAKADKAKAEADKKANTQTNAGAKAPVGNTNVQGGEVPAYSDGSGAYAPQDNTGNTGGNTENGGGGYTPPQAPAYNPPANNGGGQTPSAPPQAPATPPVNNSGGNAGGNGSMGSGAPSAGSMGDQLAQESDNAQNSNWNW